MSGCNAATIPWIRVFSIPMSVDVLGGLRLALGEGVALWQLCTIFAVLLVLLLHDCAMFTRLIDARGHMLMVLVY